MSVTKTVVVTDKETGLVKSIHIIPLNNVQAGEELVMTEFSRPIYTDPPEKLMFTHPSKAWHEKPVTVLFALVGASLITSLLAGLFGALMWRLFSSIPF